MSNEASGQTESILNIIKGIDEKSIMLPEFQRDFRWELEQTCDLFDSLIQNIFIGAIIYGKPSFGLTVRELDQRPRKGAGSHKKPQITSFTADQMRKKKDTENFRIVLDGQQRLTSIYRAIKGIDKVYLILRKDIQDVDLSKPADIALENIYECVENEERNDAISIWLYDVYEYEANGLDDDELNNRFCNSLFGKSLTESDDETRNSCQRIYRIAVRKMRDIFKESKLVSYYLLDMDLKKFCTFFERSNSRGIQLDFTDILAAKLYEGFNLREKIEELSESTQYRINKEVLIRTIAYIVSSNSGQTETIEKSYILSELEANNFNMYWSDVANCYTKALEYLKTNHWIVSQDWMPSENMLIPLIIFLKKVNSFDNIDVEQSDFLKFWFWASTFSNRYSTSSNEIVVLDCKALSTIADKSRTLPYGYFAKFRPTITEADDLFGYSKKASALYKGVHNLICYHSKGIRNWNNGNVIADTSKLEDHHIYPSSYVKNTEFSDITPDQASEIKDSVVNKALIPEKLNIKIGNKSPYTYLQEISKINPDLCSCLESYLIPIDITHNQGRNSDLLFMQFLNERAQRIFELIEQYAIYPREQMQGKYSSPLITSVQYKPKNLKELIETGKVLPNDEVYIPKFPDKLAIIIDYKTVEFENSQLTINDWAKQLLETKSVNIYDRVFLKRLGVSLDDLRKQ